jgi:hypothetical protein
MKRAIKAAVFASRGCLFGEFHTFGHLIEKQTLIRKLRKLQLKK